VTVKSQPRDTTSYMHFRLRDKRNKRLLPRGGLTVMYVDKETPKIIWASCSPLDHYSKKRGRDTCQARNQNQDLYHTKELDRKLKPGDNAEKLIKGLLATAWENRRYQWMRQGILPMFKKNHRTVLWENVDLILTSRKRKKGIVVKSKKNGKARKGR